MTTLVDANVLLDVFTADPRWTQWSRERLGAALAAGAVVVDPIIYAEVSPAFAYERELEREGHCDPCFGSGALDAAGLAR